MPGGLTLLASAPGDIPTPAAGKVTIFFNTSTSLPSYKDDAGVVHSLVGDVGQQGEMGPAIPFLFDQGSPEPMMMPTSGGGSGGGSPKSTTVLTTGVGATYNVPAGIRAIIVECIGGGGGGGGGANGGGTAGGGGGGAYCRKVYTVTPAQAFTYTVGTGGAGGIAGNNAGTAGNATTFDNAGTPMSAGGGTGGAGGAAGGGLAAAGGGVGGAVTGGDLNMRGPSRGMSGYRLGPTLGIGGLGGHTVYGPGGGNNLVDTTASSAVAGMGGGGAGAVAIGADRAGGAGADGFIVITEFGI